MVASTVFGEVDTVETMDGEDLGGVGVVSCFETGDIHVEHIVILKVAG